MSETIYGFTKRDATALKSIANAAMGGQGDTGSNSNGVHGLGNETRVCKTVAAIPARTSDTAGKAEDVLWYVISETGDMTEVSGPGMTVYNPFSTEVAATTYILVTRISGQWVVTAEDCGA
jgi:hypothetical protein